MAILNFYLLNTSEQLDLFYSDNEKLNLKKIKEVMLEYQAPVSDDGTITGEGFVDIEIKSEHDLNFIQSYCTAQGSLGYFNEARIVDNTVKTIRVQHKYYSKSLINLTEDSELIIKFDVSNDENAKTKVKSLIESLGFEASTFRLDDSLLRKVKETFKWTAAKLEKIEKSGDNTKKVSYEIDPSDDKFKSEVDELYNEHGKMSHIQFELPYKAVGAPNFVTVKLYKDGHRIVVDEEQFSSEDSFKQFMIYLLKTLRSLKQ
jgi:hypothetical protein